MKLHDLTLDRVHEALSYDPSTGLFRWKIQAGRARIGDIAGCVSKSTGYRYIRLDRHMHRSADLAWATCHGRFPPRLVDHRSRERSDDRISNLRLATRGQNAANQAARVGSRAGLKGVHFHAQTGRWRAQIRVGGRKFSLGLHDTPEQAHQAYLGHAKQRHGRFASDGGEHR